jgi:sugar phosphate isomerase/epimerase
MARAFDELAALGCGIQLTPGNLPGDDGAGHVARSGVPTRRHHGFAYGARRTPVWSDGGACLVPSESVHPPEDGECTGDWRAWYERASAPPILEVMYPGHALGTGEDVERAMDDGVPLAVDVSHAYIQLTQGAMHERTWRRLRDYERIAEVHVSANDGAHDIHQPLRADAFGLAWARERLTGGDAVVLECYMHKLSAAERRAQLELLL